MSFVSSAAIANIAFVLKGAGTEQSRRLKKLITTHAFESIRPERGDVTPDTYILPRVTLGANVRINDTGPRLELTADARGLFPITADLYAKTRLAKPASMKRAIGFEANVVNKTVQRVVVTEVNFRLSDDGISELFWDGADWSPAASGEWNTEAEIADHIISFPMAKRGVQVIVNPKTSDPRYTPEVYWVKVLWESDIEFQEDYIARSFLSMVRNGIQPIAEFVYISPGGTSVDLSKMETPYAISGIDSTYNLSADPDRLYDVTGAWDAFAKTLTITSAAASGDRIFVRFTYRPLVALTTDQEYGEVAKIPAIVVEDVYLANTKELTGNDSVLNKAAGTGWRLLFGTQSDIVIALRALTDKEKDAQRLSEAIATFFTNVSFLRSIGLDEEFTMYLDRPYAHATVPGQAGLHAGRITVRIVGAVFYLVDAVPIHVATKPMSSGGGGGNLQLG